MGIRGRILPQHEDDAMKEMQKSEVGYDVEMEEVSSAIMDPKCHHERDTVHLCPMEEIHEKTYFLNGVSNF